MSINGWTDDPTRRPDGHRAYDRVDREEMGVPQKLDILCYEAQQRYGGDPRGGNFTLVGRPRCVLQLLVDAPEDLLRMERPIIVGTHEADVVAFWGMCKVRIRCNVKDNDLYAVPVAQLPESKPDDRRTAGSLRALVWKYQREGRKLDVESMVEFLP